MRKMKTCVLSFLVLTQGCAAETAKSTTSCEGSSCDVVPFPAAQRDEADAVVPEKWLWPGGDLYLLVARNGADTWQARTFERDVANTVRELGQNTPVRVLVIDDPDEAPNGLYVNLQTWQSDALGGYAYYGTMSANAVSRSDGWRLRHEVGHMLGLGHEHQRVDRDEFFRFRPQWTAADKIEQFSRIADWKHIGPYDPHSVMHYNSWAFGIERRDEQCATLVPVSDDLPDDQCNHNDWESFQHGLPEYVQDTAMYSEGDYDVISVLYCEPEVCGENCASSERCNAPVVLQRRDRVRAWQESSEGIAWKARYPTNATF